MARDFEINLAQFDALIRRSPEAAARGARRGLHDSLDDWVLQSRNIAPLDKGTLRRGIKAEGVRGNDLNLTAEISSTAKERNFNYAYYIHEMDAGGKNLRTPDTVKKYLDKSGVDNKDKWMRWVEEEIRIELEREGW
jgi:hypothetical protein